MHGGIAQLARALAWHARGHGFESRFLHQTAFFLDGRFYFVPGHIRFFLRFSVNRFAGAAILFEAACSALKSGIKLSSSCKL